MTATRPIVTTKSGRLQGVTDSATGVLRFLGVPYAEPPVGPLRFKPTAPVRPWEGVRSAERFGPASAQVFDPHEAPYAEFVDDPSGEPRPYVGEEDSLTLNIWTPAVDDARRPVIVWIHGGANWLESSRLSVYHGDRFAERGDVVFVSLNYRLGVFGFLDVSVLGGEDYAGSHSNGLRDQIAALEWIKANIDAFGGDPDNITLMGESAGSINISWHVGSGRLEGLVRRLVMMSGVGGARGFAQDNEGSAHTEVVGRERASEFLARIGIGSMGELQALDAPEILTRQAKLAGEENILFYMDSLFYPRLDGRYAKAEPFRAARDGRGANFDLMIGYTGYEMGLWLLWDPELDQRSPEWAAAQLANFPEPQRDDLARLYGRACPDDPPGVQGMHLLGDAIFAMPSLLIAEEWGRHNPNVWVYQFDWEANPRIRALHASDQAFMFDKTDTQMGEQLLGRAPNAAVAAQMRILSHAFQDAVIAFARTGEPASPGLPAWPRHGHADRSVMRLNVESKLESDPLKARREWWRENVYAPILHPATA